MENTEAGTEWGPPFPRAEYRQRTARTREAMRERGVDLLFVSSPPNLTWLTGYDSIWYRRTTPTGLVIRADEEETLFFDSASHSDLVKSGTGCFDGVELFDRRRAGPALETILESLKARGWLKGHLALERWSLAPGGMVLADLARIFSIGEPDRRWTDLYEKAAKSVEVVLQAMRPGDPMLKLHDVANDYIREMGLEPYAWLVGGYDMGIAIPPDWVGHTFHSGAGFEALDFEVGMTTNYENVFDIVIEDWPGGKGGSYIEMLLMTEHGLEILSQLDRRLIVV